MKFIGLTPTIEYFLQVAHLAELFGDQRKGFFIEAGAFDGELVKKISYFTKKTKKAVTFSFFAQNVPAFLTINVKL